jgi:hypothetical protein
MSNEHDADPQYDYTKLLRRREWREKRTEIIAKSPRCQKCGRKGRRFAVHHCYYDYGRLPWDYPDEAYMVVCVGKCHREADEDREEEEKDEKNFQRFGGLWEAGKKTQMPRKKELQKLAKYEAEFKTWLIQESIPPEGWDWNSELYPLWYFWNQFSDQFLAAQTSEDPQGRLF